MKHLILREGRYGAKDIKELKKRFTPKVVDIYSRQLRELFEVNFKKVKTKKNPEVSVDCIYYDRDNLLLHTLSERENDFLRTNRNKNLITTEEQKKLSGFTIAIAGLSVGGNIATTLIYNGFPKKIKLADFDILKTTNLNRIMAGLSKVGEKKIDVISRQLYEIDPWLKIVSFDKGLNEKNLKNFLTDKPKPKLIFEMIDNFRMKILIRKEARKYRVPVIMLTSLGDSCLIDIERYDTEPKTKIFNGKVDKKAIDRIMSGKITEADKKKYAVKIVGSENVPRRAAQSLKEIGKTLAGRPQLMSTVMVASGIAVFLARKIALGEQVLSGRTLFKFNDFIKA